MLTKNIDQKTMSDFQTARIGVVGVGTIASAVIKGLCTDTKRAEGSIILGPRNAGKVAALKDAFGATVTLASTNQEVVDQADWVSY